MLNARPPLIEQLPQLTEADAAAPGLSTAAVHVAVARSAPLDRYALMLCAAPPRESAAEVSVNSHQTPAFTAWSRCDWAEWPVASANVPAAWLPITTGAAA